MRIIIHVLFRVDKENACILSIQQIQIGRARTERRTIFCQYFSEETSILYMNSIFINLQANKFFISCNMPICEFSLPISLSLSLSLSISLSHFLSKVQHPTLYNIYIYFSNIVKFNNHLSSSNMV